jgi:hypothetical protein
MYAVNFIKMISLYLCFSSHNSLQKALIRCVDLRSLNVRCWCFQFKTAVNHIPQTCRPFHSVELVSFMDIGTVLQTVDMWLVALQVCNCEEPRIVGDHEECSSTDKLQHHFTALRVFFFFLP